MWPNGLFVFTAGRTILLLPDVFARIYAGKAGNYGKPASALGLMGVLR